MPPEPVPANPGWDEDLTWLDRDPERECWLDRAREHDDPPEPEEYEDYAPLTGEELAEIREAAADELLAVQAATTGRRGPGQPGSARVFPGQSCSPAAAFGPGMVFDLLPGGAQLAVAADAAVADDRFDGISEGELVGVLCAWDRVEAHAAARKLAVVAELGGGPDLIITLDPLTTDPCDHRFESRGHDPGVRLRHLSQIRYASCTSPICRRPARTCDFEHNTPYEAGGRTCLCNGGPKCRHDHRLKQHPKWKVDQLPDGTFRWTTPAGRTYTAEPTRYPI